MQSLTKLLDGADLLIAGTLGAFVGLAANVELRTVKQRLYFVVCGALSAYYLGDFAAAYFNLGDGKARTATGFLIGIFGAALLQAIVRGIHNADVWGFITSRFGAGKAGSNDQ